MKTALPSHLRPMNLGDILDTIFRLYRNNLFTFIGIVALVQIPIIIFQIALNMAFNQGVTSDMVGLMHAARSFDWERDSLTDLPIHNLLAFFASLLLFAAIQGIIAQQIINGALAHAISHRYHNQPISTLSAYSLGMRRILSLVAAGLFISIIMGLVIVVLSVVLGGCVGTFMVMAPTQESGFLASFISLFLVILIVLLILVAVACVAILFLFVTQAIVLEGYGPLRAMSRSIQLVRGGFWRVVGIVLTLYILIQVITLIPSSALGGAIGLIFDDPIKDMMMRQTLTTLVSYLAQILVLPLLLIGYTLLYYDLRIRREGYDLQLQLETISADTTRPYPQSAE